MQVGVLQQIFLGPCVDKTNKIAIGGAPPSFQACQTVCQGRVVYPDKNALKTLRRLSHF